MTEKKTGHTPGPWEADDSIENKPQHGKGGEQIFKVVKSGFGGGIVADVSCWWYDRESAKANARLIAAAPELLAACESALDSEINDFGYPDSELAKILRTAISKAKGE
jgi:hypothetical protein